MVSSTFSRRSALGSALAVGFVGTADAKTAPFDFSDKKNLLSSVVKMRGATDERVCMGYVIGTRYALVDGTATPLFGLIAGTFSQCKKVDDESYECRAFEIAYMTDLSTGNLLETWTNPFTSKTVNVPQTRTLMGKVIIKASGLMPVNSPMFAALEFNHQFRPAVTNGSDVWITEETRIRNKPGSPATAPRFRYNENTTYHAKRKDLANPTLATVPTSISYQSLINFSPWMGMDGVEGMNLGRGNGFRVADQKELPPYYLQLGEKYHADVLHDPLGAIEGKFEKKKEG